MSLSDLTAACKDGISGTEVVEDGIGGTEVVGTMSSVNNQSYHQYHLEPDLFSSSFSGIQ